MAEGQVEQPYYASLTKHSLRSSATKGHPAPKQACHSKPQHLLFTFVEQAQYDEQKNLSHKTLMRESRQLSHGVGNHNVIERKDSKGHLWFAGAGFSNRTLPPGGA